ncbi:hypothetical protein TWF694_004771 [Orbilia ellipsospora]|uniref:Uncharacterized protein n=1 Tax=Orbilia ellipsospora TaxID=2528407 RepID=A0AAV9WW55_9PEZI
MGVTFFTKEIVDHLRDFQCNIECIYEDGRLANRFTIARADMMDLFLRGRKNLKHVALASMEMHNFVPFCNLLKENQATLQSLYLDLGHFYSRSNLWDVQGSSEYEKVTKELAKYGLDFDNPPKLVNLKSLYLRDLYNAFQPNIFSSYFYSMLDLSGLDYLNLYRGPTEGEFWDMLFKSQLHLRYLTVGGGYCNFGSKVNDLLLSFTGLKELVIDYLHEPKSLKEGVLNHRSTLQKLFWRAVAPLEESSKHCFHSDDFKYLSECTNLSELAIYRMGGASKHTEQNIPLPPNLKLLWILESETFPDFPYPEIDKSAISIAERFEKPQGQRVPFKYLALEYRKTYEDGYTVLEGPFTVEVFDSSELGRSGDIVGEKYTYRVVANDELVEMDPYFSMPRQAMDWLPLSTW